MNNSVIRCPLGCGGMTSRSAGHGPLSRDVAIDEFKLPVRVECENCSVFVWVAHMLRVLDDQGDYNEQDAIAIRDNVRKHAKQLRALLSERAAERVSPPLLLFTG